VPPVLGLKAVVPPIQIEFGPVILTVGLAYIKIDAVFTEVHPVDELVKKNVEVPGVTAVTIPLLFIVATAVLLLVHVPPVFGDNDVVPPIHKEEGPNIETVGFALTVKVADGSETHVVVPLI
jgi:hypothetical protein